MIFAPFRWFMLRSLRRLIRLKKDPDLLNRRILFIFFQIYTAKNTLLIHEFQPFATASRATCNIAHSNSSLYKFELYNINGYSFCQEKFHGLLKNWQTINN